MNYSVKYFDDDAIHWYKILVNELYLPHEIPLLSNNINDAYFYKTIIVFNAEKPCGYCVVYNNTNLIFDKSTCLAIGNWECILNQDVATVMLDACINIAKKLHCKYIIGPLNGSTWDAHRFSTSIQNNKLFLGEALQKNYYLQQWQNFGYSNCTNYISTMDTNLQKYNEAKILKYETQLLQNGVVIRNINLNNYASELENIYTFCTKAFANNFLYSPISQELFIEKYTALLKYLDATYIYIAEKNNTIVGLLFAYVDALCTTHKQVILKTIAVDSNRQNAGLAYVLGNLLAQNCMQNNVTSIIHAFMHVQNNSTLASKSYNTKPYNAYALLIKEIV